MNEPTTPPTPNPNRRAHIHNAITEGLTQAGEWAPLSVRAAAARAVLAEVDAWHAQEDPPADVIAVIEEALRDSLDEWWQTPPRLDWAAAAVHAALGDLSRNDAEEDAGPTWLDRADHADHATQLYAQTAIERDDAQAEVRRLRAIVSQLTAGRETWRAKAIDIERDRNRLLAEHQDGTTTAPATVLRPVLRSRITNALGPLLPDPVCTRDTARQIADAVLGVLPLPTAEPHPAPGEVHTAAEYLGYVLDHLARGGSTPHEATIAEALRLHTAELRPAILREAADQLTMDWGGPDHDDGMDEARKQLRRMADEAPQGCVCGEPTDADAVHCTDGPCYTAEDQPVSLAAAEICRCGHRADQHQGDQSLGGAQCRVCPGDDERSWRHPHTPDEAQQDGGAS